jgi:hypothetical protein
LLCALAYLDATRARSLSGCSLACLDSTRARSWPGFLACLDSTRARSLTASRLPCPGLSGLHQGAELDGFIPTECRQPLPRLCHFASVNLFIQERQDKATRAALPRAKGDSMADKTRIEWYAVPKQSSNPGASRPIKTGDAIGELIGEFADFSTEDERQRWKAFIDSKGGFEAFAMSYAIALCKAESPAQSSRF